MSEPLKAGDRVEVLLGMMAGKRGTVRTVYMSSCLVVIDGVDMPPHISGLPFRAEHLKKLESK